MVSCVYDYWLVGRLVDLLVGRFDFFCYLCSRVVSEGRQNQLLHATVQQSVKYKYYVQSQRSYTKGMTLFTPVVQIRCSSGERELRRNDVCWSPGQWESLCLSLGNDP